jgi:hypothetical protein
MSFLLKQIIADLHKRTVIQFMWHQRLFFLLCTLVLRTNSTFLTCFITSTFISGQYKHSGARRRHASMLACEECPRNLFKLPSVESSVFLTTSSLASDHDISLPFSRVSPTPYTFKSSAIHDTPDKSPTATITFFLRIPLSNR